MVKKLMLLGSIVISAMTLMFAQTSLASEVTYKEGVHYQVKNTNLTKTKEIREFFSFWCGHCFSLQDDFKKIADAYQGKANFVANPVYMLGGPVAVDVQRAFIIAKSMGLEAKFTKELFDQMHVKGNIPRNHEDVAAFMLNLGVPQDKFTKEFNSFAVIGQVATMDKWANDVDLDAVPEILVNGKYLITMESVETVDDLIKLIGYVLELDQLPDAK